jgi:hypothetical protein
MDLIQSIRFLEILPSEPGKPFKSMSTMIHAFIGNLHADREGSRTICDLWSRQISIGHVCN